LTVVRQLRAEARCNAVHQPPTLSHKTAHTAAAAAAYTTPDRHAHLDSGEAATRRGQVQRRPAAVGRLRVHVRVMLTPVERVRKTERG
jgi:hypothetical protein